MLRFAFIMFVALTFGILLHSDLTANERSKPTKLETATHLPDNFITVGPGLFSGAEPEGKEAFNQLKKLGVQVIISVDGKAPNVELAKELGLRYIHIPIGYGELSPKAQLTIVRVATEIDVPLYLHCHHGKHRGPAAMAVLCRANSRFTKQQAEDYLHKAGTSPEYAGLWKSVRKFELPDNMTTWPELEETAQVDLFASNMAEMERQVETLDHLLDDHETISKSSQIKIQTTALVLQELVKESRRAISSPRKTDPNNNEQQLVKEDAKLLIALKQHEKRINTLRESLSSGNNGLRWKKEVETIKQDCRNCHVQFRN